MRLSLDVPDDLHRKAKVKAASERLTLSQVVRQLLQEYLEGTAKPRPVTSATPTASGGLNVVAPATPRPKPPPGPNFVRPISKADQAKGKSRK